MDDVAQLLISRSDRPALVVHAFSPRQHGVEDGLSLLSAPDALMEKVCSLWSHLELRVFAYSVSSREPSLVPRVMKSWRFYSEGVERWAFAILLEPESDASKRLEYISTSFTQDSRRIQILSRHGKNQDLDLLTRHEEAAAFCQQIKSTCCSVTQGGWPKGKEVDIVRWFAHSPIVFVPFFTQHGEGVELYLPSDGREHWVSAIRDKVQKCAHEEGFRARFVDDIRNYVL